MEVEMDERFRGKGLWIGLGAIAIVFLCIMLCGMGAMFAGPSSQVYVQPPVAQEGSAPPPPAMYGHAGIGRYGTVGPLGFVFGAIGALFRLAFLGLLLLLGLGLVKRIFIGHRCWGPLPGWKPPEGQEGAGKPHAAWEPQAWRHHHKHWGPPPWWNTETDYTAENGEQGEQYDIEE
jgi:hypothetical protein